VNGNGPRVAAALCAAALTLVGTVGPASAEPAAPPAPDAPPPPVLGAGALDAVRGGRAVDVVVMLEEGATGGGLAAAQQAARAAQDRVLAGAGSGVAVRHRFRTVPAFTARATPAALERLAAHPEVRKIDLDEGAGTGTLATVVPLVDADDIHATGTRGSGVAVAVLDSGHDRDHPDLAGATVFESCFGSLGGTGTTGFCHNGTSRQTGAGAAEDDAGHGTHVTGIVTSAGVVSSVGVAPDTSIVAVKVTDDCSFGGCFYAFSEITAALDDLASRPSLGIDVVNMSLGTNALFAGDCDSATSWLMAASSVVTRLRNAGVMVFAAAGNNSSTTQMAAPGCLRDVISVGATTSTNSVASFSNTSTTTDLLAPGVNVVSDAIGGGTTTASGTSMASPVAAGCAALLKQRLTSATVSQLESAMESTGVAVTRGTATFRRIDCDAAFASLDRAPVANAGADRSLPSTDTSTELNGSGSSDPEHLPLRFNWVRIAGDPVTIESPTSARTRVTGLAKGKSYTFRLTVTDPWGHSSSDTVVVTVSSK
jgi:subtilisin family serine protease